jgi:hypothetical protein
MHRIFSEGWSRCPKVNRRYSYVLAWLKLVGSMVVVAQIDTVVATALFRFVCTSLFQHDLNASR